ncbi:sugar phosphate nucleotidyltransferase [Acetatifactor aquisgranensis]|uniref:sugar phosphate nucleotidyltransferase n=1 Tax=Acetatifactor aquisgranensis TaxID=2941233 RepID=UPI00203B8261|nr:sugar phosphate nucleotidyltransferase [Acetatifactor aquisgranensis]
MNIILLSGGSGKRLWPLSNDIRSKQFVRMLSDENGGFESMLERVYRQIAAMDSQARITIATGKKQVSLIKNQLGDKVSVCVEPCRRDTFPAVCLAASYLRDVQAVGEDESVVVCPVDPYVEASYFEALKEMAGMAAAGGANLYLMGIAPTYPSEKYGYIIPASTNRVSGVDTFREKPDAATAEKYIAQGALWNGGVFAFRLGYLLRKARELLDFTDYRDLDARYSEIKKISFDVAVAEQEKEIQVLRYEGQWKDLGTWNTFSEAMADYALGRVMLNETCENTHVVNELNIPILCMGCKDMVIAASNDGILISDKEQSSYIKPFVEQIEQQVMYVEKSWGSFTVLDVQEDSLTIKIALLPGHALHYHSHEHRDEVWTVMSGRGKAVIDGVWRNVAPGDVISMPAGCRHTVSADSELKIIEVQMGRDISVEDKQKYELPFQG